MTVVAIMSTSDGTPRLDAVVRPGAAAPDIDGSEEIQELLLGLNVTAGDPPEPMSPADGDDWIQALPWALHGTYSWAEYVSHGRHGDPIVPADFDHRLELFEADLRRHELVDGAVRTYVTHSKRFIKWAQGPPGANVALSELLERYRESVEARDLAPLTIQSYLQGASMFVRWLQGAYRPGDRLPPSQDRGDREDDAWLGEQETQVRLVRWLEADGWRITDQHVGHQHGVDVTAERGGTTMVIEVKGHPQDRLIAGEGKGQVRVYHPAAQARTYFANALHAALTMSQKDRRHLIAIALPDKDRYRNMVEMTRSPLERLGIGVYLVPQSGPVEALVPARLDETDGI
jgi:Holliday junction resolvase